MAADEDASAAGEAHLSAKVLESLSGTCGKLTNAYMKTQYILK